MKLKDHYSIIIRRPVNEVFDFVATNYFENRPKWVPELTEFEKTSEGLMGVGTTGREVGRDIWGRLIETTFVVTEYEPFRIFSVEGKSVFVSDDNELESASASDKLSASTTFTGSTTFESNAQGTTMTSSYELELTLERRYWLYMPPLARRLREASEEARRRLKNMMEAEIGLPPMRQPLRISAAWIAFAVAALITIGLWWTYASRDILQVPEDVVPRMRMALSSMIVIVIVWFFLIRSNFRPG